MQLRRVGNAESQTSHIRKTGGRTAKGAMTGGFTAQVRAMAQTDAKRGEYMGDTFVQYRRSHMKKFVSPDRAGPKMQMTRLLQEAAQEKDSLLVLLDRMLGGCTGKLRSSRDGQTAVICAPNGEEIASYNSLGGGWTEIQTKEEQKFLSEAASVYLQAYREARAAMQPPPETAVDLRA